MSHEELKREFKQLPPAERQALLDELSGSLFTGADESSLIVTIFLEARARKLDVENLTPEDLAQLISEVWRSTRSEISTRREKLASNFSDKARPDKHVTGRALDRQTLSQRLYGILEFDNAPPNDEEVDGMVSDYLIRKYS